MVFSCRRDVIRSEGGKVGWHQLILNPAPTPADVSLGTSVSGGTCAIQIKDSCGKGVRVCSVRLPLMSDAFL